ALWLNEQGFHRARAAKGVDLVGKISLYTSDAFAKRNNNCTAAEMRERVVRWLDLYAEAGVTVERALVMTAFGCNYEGEIPPERPVEELLWAHRVCAERGIDLKKLYFADTMGWANPQAVRRLVGMLREKLPAVEVGLHLHDTRGLGTANVLAALEMGVSLFDSSVAGLGGCPFAGHGDARGAGNICTEDMVFLCHEMGIETGIDLDRLIEAARLAESLAAHSRGGSCMLDRSGNTARLSCGYTRSQVSQKASIAVLILWPATSRGMGAPGRRMPFTVTAAFSQPMNRLGM
ncbi:MAG: hypothetical protein NTX90_00780, partial [Alphaproteobacteria bacterium]|nr:hypothetical protein [Alphaproteobacteria bacterium]